MQTCAACGNDTFKQYERVDNVSYLNAIGEVVHNEVDFATVEIIRTQCEACGHVVGTEVTSMQLDVYSYLYDEYAGGH